MRFVIGSALVLAIALTAARFFLSKPWVNEESLTTRLERIQRADNLPQIPCAGLSGARPLVLLALGQSNAGNHGSRSERPTESIMLFADGKCVQAGDPLPGATGVGGSIWQLLPALLSREIGPRPVILSVFAVDSTTIDDWTNSQSLLVPQITSRIATMKQSGLTPDLILWQQGEADARAGTSRGNYAKGLQKLSAVLHKSGTDAPIILALSTICRTAPSTEIRTAIQDTVATDWQFRLGPDTDTLSSETYRNGCHLTTEGLESAARMWSATIGSELSIRKQARSRNSDLNGLEHRRTALAHRSIVNE